MKIPKPEEVPENGFYYHYKHDKDGPINEGAYEFLNVSCNTEDDCHPDDANLLNYRPLYKSSPVYKAGKLWWGRRLKMVIEPVTKDGKTFPRFTKITDPAVIAELTKIRDEMYAD